MLLALTAPRAFPQQEVKTAAQPSDLPPAAMVRVGTFPEEFRRAYTVKDGLPSDDVRALAIKASGDVYAATARGLARFSAGKWTTSSANGEAVEQVAARGDGIWYISNGRLIHLHGASFTLPPAKVNHIAISEKTFLATDAGLYILSGKKFVLDSRLARLLGSEKAIRQVAVAADGRIAVAAAGGLFLKQGNGAWGAVNPRNSTCSWALYDVRGVAFDSRNRLWFSSVQGAGCEDGEWHLYTGADGLPYNDFIALSAGENGTVWFGTKLGAIRYDGKDWEYRQGLRWLPHDDVRSIAVNGNGDAWFATSAGVGVIERRPSTLAAKARFFEDEIDKRHRRTSYGYINYVNLKHPGDATEWEQGASDNDGLRTALYGAGECFAYAATKDPLARQRAKAAFEALRFLRVVTEGGPHPAPKGFIARSILPTGGRDPNLDDSPARDERTRDTQDALWKIITPRWPVSADGKWYWESDTSADDLDGHFFFYALYYDLVVGTEEERSRVREHVAAVAEHLIDHNFQLVDHDGKPTRWAVFNPERLNHDFSWRERRGTNSLSILAYLKVAAHITGDARFAAASRWLIEQHSYAANVLIPMAGVGSGSGNPMEDETTYLNYYNLIRYETDPILRQTYALALSRQWKRERPGLNPLFGFIYAASCTGQTTEDAFGKDDLSPKDNAWLEESVDTLMRFPMDLVNWRVTNSHRQDVIHLPDWLNQGCQIGAAGYRVNGKALPIDERAADQRSGNPWQLDEVGDGMNLTDGGAFLLPYYMGLYHKYIGE